MDEDEIELTWDHLPPAALISVFKHLSVSDILKHASKTNRSWFTVMTSNEIWRERFENDLLKLSNLEHYLENPAYADETSFLKVFMVDQTKALNKLWPRKIPPNFFFIEFMKVWTLAPHAWLGGEKTRVTFFAMLHENPEKSEWKPNILRFGTSTAEMYNHWQKWWKFEQRCTWIRVWTAGTQINNWCPFRISWQINRSFIYSEVLCPPQDPNDTLVPDFLIQENDATILVETHPKERIRPYPYVVVFSTDTEGRRTEFFPFRTSAKSKGTKWKETFMFFHRTDSYDLLGAPLCDNCQRQPASGACGYDCGKTFYCSQLCAQKHYSVHQRDCQKK